MTKTGDISAESSRAETLLDARSAGGPIRRFLDLSTAHLEVADRIFLEFSADPGKRDGLAVMAGTYGWFVYAYDDRCCEGISDVLWTIFERARALGCDYVLFDADGPVMEGLPVFEQGEGEAAEEGRAGAVPGRAAVAPAPPQG